MNMRSNVVAVVLATLWISLSEFVRNEFILKSAWTSHYQSMGLEFPSNLINGATWGVWSLCMALLILVIAQKYSLRSTIIITWFAGFVLMWLVIGNLGVLPISTLVLAVPLSVVEISLAAWLIQRFATLSNRLPSIGKDVQ